MISLLDRNWFDQVERMMNIGVLHLGNVAIVAEDALRIGHYGLQLILKAESFFKVHCIHSSSLFVDTMISVSVAVVIELLV